MKLLVLVRGGSVSSTKYAWSFGTFLAVGAIVAAIWGPPIVDRYLGFYA